MDKDNIYKTYTTNMSPMFLQMLEAPVQLILWNGADGQQ